MVDAERQATELLKASEAKLHELAKALLEYEVLDNREIERILEGLPLEREAPKPPPQADGAQADGAPQEPEARET